MEPVQQPRAWIGSPMIGAGHPFIAALRKVLGLPERVVRFTLFAEVGKPVEVGCSFYPSVESGELASEEFRLVRREVERESSINHVRVADEPER